MMDGIKMVEKKAFKAHHRNISSVSDISVTIDPIKREDGQEIKVILLLDSRTEQKCMFDVIHKSLLDRQSPIEGVKVLNHNWEQTHNDCQGPECQFCIKTTTGTNINCIDERRGSVDTDLVLHQPSVKLKARHQSIGNGLASSANCNDDSYFRFYIEGQPIRLRLLSKDRQSLLKLISFDFLVVCMQVQKQREDRDSHFSACLDENIWEYEFKRLNKHKKKFLAPIILLGYFRDILRLGQIGHGDAVSLEKIIHESKLKVQRVSRKYRAVPRFCDFVTGSSQELYELFADLKKMFHQTGYILQQCALANNVEHFKMVLESVSCTEEDLLFTDAETGDNPVMIAAKLRHKDLVSDVLRSSKVTSVDTTFLETFIHSRNKSDQTLLHMVALQGPELEEQKLLILRREIEIHCNNGDLAHESDQRTLQRCIRKQLKSSAEAAVILQQVRDLQGIPKTEKELKAEKGKVWARLFFSTLFLSLIFNAIDIGSDTLILIRYMRELSYSAYTSLNNTTDLTGANDNSSELMGKNENNFAEPCDRDYYGVGMTTDHFAKDCQDKWLNGSDIELKCFPMAMDSHAKFGYTLFFILVPWPFFIYEFFTSQHYDALVTKGANIVEDMARCPGILNLIKCYLKLIFHTITFFCCVMLWPFAVLFIKYYNDGKYYLAKGPKRVTREKKLETSEVLYSTARVMEVSLESSFQPTVQLYLLLPSLIDNMTKDKIEIRLIQVCMEGELPIFQADQTISIITSILSLSWCFTSYHATLKRGALDKDLAALFYRVVLFLSVLFQIIGRLFILVFFAYSFGPGRYHPLLFFVAFHILLMSALHFVFSDAKRYWVKGGFLNISFFHYLLGNGLANIYIHNWIRMDPLLVPWEKPLQHVSTLVRQFLIDFIIITENCVLLGIALNSNITELKENQAVFTVVLLGFHLVGLILKCVYYRYLHMWAWLIMDYVVKEVHEDGSGHWECSLISHMFLCGKLKERNLTLCYVPGPIFRIFKFFFGEKTWCEGHSCSVCGALVGFLLLPIAIVLAILAFTISAILIVLFMPVFIVFILPILIVTKCRRDQDSETVMKISEEQRCNDDVFSQIRKESVEGTKGVETVRKPVREADTFLLSEPNPPTPSGPSLTVTCNSDLTSPVDDLGTKV